MITNWRVVGGGWDFGERALITNEPRSATVMTTTATDLLVVDRDVFSRCVTSVALSALVSLLRAGHFNPPTRKNCKRKRSSSIVVRSSPHGHRDSNGSSVSVWNVADTPTTAHCTNRAHPLTLSISSGGRRSLRLSTLIQDSSR